MEISSLRSVSYFWVVFLYLWLIGGASYKFGNLGVFFFVYFVLEESFGSFLFENCQIQRCLIELLVHSGVSCIFDNSWGLLCKFCNQGGRGVNDTRLLIYSTRIIFDKMGMGKIFFFVSLLGMGMSKNLFSLNKWVRV